jgi:hypothetical protein
MSIINAAPKMFLGMAAPYTLASAKGALPRRPFARAGPGGGKCYEIRGRANGPDAKLRGQGPRAEARAARRMPACESRDAGGVTPSKLR